MLGNLVGSWIAYGVGRAGRLELVERHGHWLHLKPSHIAWADRWFERYGAAGGLLQPHAADHPHVHLAAGRRREDAVRALHGCSRSRAACRGCSGSRSLEKQSGSEWKSVRKGFEYVDYAVVALVVTAIVYAIIRRRRGRSDTGERRHRCGAESPPPALRHAVALGLLQGPTELLPISSSAHTTLIPWLAGWPYGELDGELRKSFEVALHAGAGLALAIDMRSELIERGVERRRRRLAVIRALAGAAGARGVRPASASSSAGSAGRARSRRVWPAAPSRWRWPIPPRARWARVARTRARATGWRSASRRRSR